jgi:hypothetical protein
VKPIFGRLVDHDVKLLGSGPTRLSRRVGVGSMGRRGGSSGVCGRIVEPVLPESLRKDLVDPFSQSGITASEQWKPGARAFSRAHRVIVERSLDGSPHVLLFGHVMPSRRFGNPVLEIFSQMQAHLDHPSTMTNGNLRALIAESILLVTKC